MDIEELKGLMFDVKETKRQMDRHNIPEREREEFYNMHKGKFEVDAYELFVWLGY